MLNSNYKTNQSLKMVNATTVMNTRTRFYSLPFISNYVRDENNNVYCTSTRAFVGKWSNTHGVIEIEGEYYHGPSVESSQNQHSTEIEFTPEPPSPPRNSETNLSDYFQMDYYENEPIMEPLELDDLMPEEGEIVELYPIEGASQFKYSNYGHVVMSDEQELSENTTMVGYPITKTWMKPQYYKKVIYIRFFPQYRYLSSLVENQTVVVQDGGAPVLASQ